MNRSELSQGQSPTRYFIRDDDVDELTPALRLFVEAFVAQRIPVSYQIIPAGLTADCAQYLLEIERAYPDLVEFGQHGLHHRMVLRGKALKREFGPERSLAQQSQDIEEGLRILRERLGADREISIFTPPQHKFDRNTLVAAAAAGHRIFSAACYPSSHHRLAYALGRKLGLSSIRHHGISYHGRQRPEARLREISISVAVDNGRWITCPAPDLNAALDRAQQHADTVGLMFHHKVYEDAPEQLASIVAQLAKRRDANFHKLADLSAAA